MKNKSASPVIVEIPLAKASKKMIKSSIFNMNNKKSKLPDKDKRFLDELMKKNNEGVIHHLTGSIMPSIKQGSSKTRGMSLIPEKMQKEKKIIKCTTSSDFKKYEDRKEIKSIKAQSIIESITGLDNNLLLDSSYKYFVGNGNNDNLVKKILNAKPG